MDEKREKKATVAVIENIIDERLALGIVFVNKFFHYKRMNDVEKLSV